MSKQDILKNPWMDFASYGIKDASRFKGREEEIKKFLRIIDSGTMSVLYANSGIGKTSFLNAGISPIYQKMGYFPIHIVFPDEVFTFKDIEPWLLQRITDAYIKQEGNSSEEQFTWESIIGTEIEECKDSLWWHLHTKVMKNHNTGETFYPLLIFDQFEEIFTKAKKYANGEIVGNFFKLVGNLASTSLPSIIEEELDRQDDKGNYVEIDSEHHYKVVFSLRKEYLSDFDYWTNDVNSISELHQNRMFLLPLKRDQALKVITEQPIEGSVNEFYSTLNNVTDKILDLIDPRKKDEIEPFMLSALCSKLYNKAASANKQQLVPSDVDANINNIVLEIYEEKVQRVFDSSDHLRRLEEALVDADGHRNRPKIKELDDIQFKEIYQQQLEDAHLIRIDTYDDDTYIELIHDLLAKAINKKREEEEQDRRIAELERSKKRQKYIYGGIVALLLAVLAYGIYSLYSMPEPVATDDTSLYLLCIKADIQEDSEGKTGFKHDDFWDVNLFLKTKDGRTLSLKHQIDSAQCNFHKGGTGTDRITLTFTKAERESLGTIGVLILPTTTLCKRDSFPIDLKRYLRSPDKVDTFHVKITKNFEETDSYGGFVYTDLGNSGKKIPLSDVLIAVAGRTFYTDSTGHYDLSIPRGNAFSNHIYIIKQGYCIADTVLKDNIEINLKRDSMMNFAQRQSDTKELWEIAHVSNRKKELNANDVIIMDRFLIDDKKKLRRGLNVKDSLFFVFYDNSKVQNVIDDNVDAKDGDVRKIIGMYQDKKKRHYIFEGFATMVKPDSAQWLLDITQYDSIFNTRNRKATLIHANEPSKTKLLFSN